MIALPIYLPTSSYTISASTGQAGGSQPPAVTKLSKFLSKKLKNGTKRESLESKVPQLGKSNGQGLSLELSLPLAP